MQIPQFLVLTATLILAGIGGAQPPEVPKQEIVDQRIARGNAERKARTMSDFKTALRDKLKVPEADIDAIQTFIERQDEQLQLVRNALYQMMLASDAEVSDAEFAVFWSDFQTLSARGREQKARESAQLSQRLNLGQNARLRAFLSPRGVIGDDLLAITSASQNVRETDLLQYYLKRELGVEKPRRVVIPEPKQP